MVIRKHVSTASFTQRIEVKLMAIAHGTTYILTWAQHAETINNLIKIRRQNNETHEIH